MSDKISEYIKNEKDFSRFKMQTLERSSSKHKDRLIKKERDFLDFDFGLISFSSVSDCRQAIDLFKASKSHFMVKYNLKTKRSINEQRKLFLENKSKNISVTGPGEIDNFRMKSLKSEKYRKLDGTTRSVYSKMIELCKTYMFFMKKYISSNGDIPSSVDLIFQNTDLLSNKSFKYFCSGIRRIDPSEVLSIVHKTESTSLVVLNIPHRGNEKINCIGMNLVSYKGSVILPVKFKFANCNIDGIYMKAILVDRELSENIDFVNSDIFIGKSRRFMEHFSDAKTWSRLIRLHLEEIL